MYEVKQRLGKQWIVRVRKDGIEFTQPARNTYEVLNEVEKALNKGYKVFIDSIPAIVEEREQPTGRSLRAVRFDEMVYNEMEFDDLIQHLSEVLEFTGKAEWEHGIIDPETGDFVPQGE